MTPGHKQFGAAGEKLVQRIATPAQRSAELATAQRCTIAAAAERQLSRLSQRSAAYV